MLRASTLVFHRFYFKESQVRLGLIMKKLLFLFVVALSILGTSNAMKQKYDFDLADCESCTKKWRVQLFSDIQGDPDIEDLFKIEVITQENLENVHDDNEVDEQVDDGAMLVMIDYKQLDLHFFDAVAINKIDEVRRLLNNEQYFNHVSYDMLQLAFDETKCISMKRILAWAIEKKSPNWAAEKDMFSGFLRLHV